LPLPLRRNVFFILVLLFFIPGCARAPRRVLTPAIVPSVSAPYAGISGFYHTVEPKQTIYRIAKTYNMDWHELTAINGITDPSRLEVGQKILIPQHVSQEYEPVSVGPVTVENIQRLVGPKHYAYPWLTITVHHSGTLQGNAEAFHKNHLKRRMGGLFYHFVIGNGTETSDGALEVGWRWQKQVKANRPNDIQICLVGDFNRQRVSEAQFSTLVNLIEVLRQEYNIPIGGIRKHEDIKGRATECPGRNFPFQRLIQELKRRG
jgi:LysM repeat protein